MSAHLVYARRAPISSSAVTSSAVLSWQRSVQVRWWAGGRLFLIRNSILVAYPDPPGRISRNAIAIVISCASPAGCVRCTCECTTPSTSRVKTTTSRYSRVIPNPRVPGYSRAKRLPAAQVLMCWPSRTGNRRIWYLLRQSSTKTDFGFISRTNCKRKKSVVSFL